MALITQEMLAEIRRDDAARDLSRHLRARIPSYRRGVPEAELLASCEENLRRWERWVTAGAPPEGEDLEALRASVRSRAAEGVPLEDLLAAYRLAGRLAWGLLRRRAEAADAPALLDAGAMMGEYLDTICRTVTEAYLGGGGRLVSEEERPCRRLLDRLLREGALEPGELRLAEHLGVPVRDAYHPFAAALADGSAARHAALSARLRARGVALAVTEGRRVFGLAWRPVAPRHLEEDGDALLAVAGEAPRDDLADVRRDLELLVDHGREAGMRGVVACEERLPELLLARSPRLAAALRARVVEPLERADHVELRRTLETLVACNFDRACTSRALHVHRNTLRYRLRRVEELTGLDLGRPRDIASVYLALAAARVR